MDWIDLDQDKDQWRALVNMVMNLQGSTKCRKIRDYLSHWRLLKRGSAPWSLLVKTSNIKVVGVQISEVGERLSHRVGIWTVCSFVEPTILYILYQCMIISISFDVGK
jgi:hypothetical protein